MRARYKVFPRVFKLTLRAGGNNKTNKTYEISLIGKNVSLPVVYQKYNFYETVLKYDSLGSKHSENPILFRHGQFTEQKKKHLLFLIRKKYKHFIFWLQGK